MPQGGISDRDLKFLRRVSLDRDRWAGVEVEYYPVDEVATSFDPVTKETEYGDWNFETASPIRLNAFMKVVPYREPHSRIDQIQAAGPEHTVEFRFGLRQLQERGVSPQPKDIIRVQGINYLVWGTPKEKITKHSTYNIDVIVTTRREHSMIPNPDLPEDTNPEVY